MAGKHFLFPNGERDVQATDRLATFVFLLSDLKRRSG
jgi:hypothetical protein